jgi:hypothetical protein
MSSLPYHLLPEDPSKSSLPLSSVIGGCLLRNGGDDRWSVAHIRWVRCCGVEPHGCDIGTTAILQTEGVSHLHKQPPLCVVHRSSPSKLFPWHFIYPIAQIRFDTVNPGFLPAFMRIYPATYTSPSVVLSFLCVTTLLTSF